MTIDEFQILIELINKLEENQNREVVLDKFKEMEDRLKEQQGAFIKY